MIETLGDILEELANSLGIYGSGPEGDHPEGCRCRICFVCSMRTRIEQAVEVERRLEQEDTYRVRPKVAGLMAGH